MGFREADCFHLQPVTLNSLAVKFDSVNKLESYVYNCEKIVLFCRLDIVHSIFIIHI